MMAVWGLFVTPGVGAATPERAPADRSDGCREVIQDDGFVLPDGEKVSLSHMAQGTPLAVVVIKGHWCPVCTDQLKSLSRRSKEVRRTGGTVVGLSTEDAGTNRMLMEKHGLAFPMLGEPSARLLEHLGFWMPEMGHPMPGLIFLDHCGDFAGAKKGRRPGTSQDRLILETLKDLSRRDYACGPPA
jgi:peroxiredoxin